jgi:hypothetical protein
VPIKESSRCRIRSRTASWSSITTIQSYGEDLASHSDLEPYADHGNVNVLIDYLVGTFDMIWRRALTCVVVCLVDTRFTGGVWYD